MSCPSRFEGLERRRVDGIEVPVADTYRSRLLGLAFLRVEEAGEGLLIPRCRRVHTVGMRFRLDIVFLGREGEVLGVVEAVPAGRFVSEPRADSVLEIPSNGCRSRALDQAAAPRGLRGGAHPRVRKSESGRVAGGRISPRAKPFGPITRRTG